MAPVTEAAPPRRVESTVLVLEQFNDRSGTEWRPGDRAPLHSRAVRQVAMERPELFVMEYETAPVDLDWLRELDLRYEAEYQEAKKLRDEREAGREKALRDEMKAQDAPQPELERRYERQEKERAEWEKKAREERERQKLEGELAFQRGSGFHVF